MRILVELLELRAEAGGAPQSDRKPPRLARSSQRLYELAMHSSADLIASTNIRHTERGVAFLQAFCGSILVNVYRDHKGLPLVIVPTPMLRLAAPVWNRVPAATSGSTKRL